MTRCWGSHRMDRPQSPAQSDADLLTEDLTPRPLSLPVTGIRPGGQSASRTTGKRADRHAMGRSVTQRPEAADARRSTSRSAPRVPSVRGRRSARGPLQRADDGSVSPFTFDGPTWARFIRFTEGHRHGQDRIHRGSRDVAHSRGARERPLSLRCRRVGAGQPRRPTRVAGATAGSVVAVDAGEPNNTPETATPLAAASVAWPRAPRRGRRLVAAHGPGRAEQPDIPVGGSPTVGVRLTLLAADGSEVPMSLPGRAAGRRGVRRTSNPVRDTACGSSSRRSRRLSFDTSGSIVNYYPFIAQALRALHRRCRHGRGIGHAHPVRGAAPAHGLERRPILLEDAVNRYVGYGSSSAETALIEASKELSGRRRRTGDPAGHRRHTASYQRDQQLWGRWPTSGPSSSRSRSVGTLPVQSPHFMQDWSTAGGGFYQYVVSHGEMDRAFTAWPRGCAVPPPTRVDARHRRNSCHRRARGRSSVVAPTTGGQPARAPVGLALPSNSSSTPPAACSTDSVASDASTSPSPSSPTWSGRTCRPARTSHCVSSPRSPGPATRSWRCRWVRSTRSRWRRPSKHSRSSTRSNPARGRHPGGRR